MRRNESKNDHSEFQRKGYPEDAWRLCDVNDAWNLMKD